MLITLYVPFCFWRFFMILDKFWHSEKRLPQLLWPERTLEMNVSPSPAGHLFFDRFEKFVFKKKLDRNFQISYFKKTDFIIFRYQISKFPDFRFQKYYCWKSEIWIFRSNFYLTNFSNRSKNKWPAGDGDALIFRDFFDQSNHRGVIKKTRIFCRSR